MKSLEPKPAPLIEYLFILDEETTFLSGSIKKKKYKVIDDHDSLLDFLGSPYTLRNVIILVELDWGNPISLFHGYEVARKLIDNQNRQSTFNLLFISTLQRETLYRVFKGKNRVFTKSHPHEKIDLAFDIQTLKVPVLSKKKFEYLRRYCLTESGILDRLEHDFRPGRSISSKQAQDLIQQIKANADIVGAEVISLLHESDDKTFPQIRRRIHEKIIDRINEIHPSSQENSGHGNDQVFWKPTLLLVEDNADQLEKIASHFERSFKVEKYSDGQSSLNYLKSSAEKVSVAICDMELLQSTSPGLDQDVQGIDVIEYIKNHHPHIVLKVESHLPRRGLELLLKDTVKVSDLIHKSMLLEGNDDFIKDLIADIQKEIDQKKAYQKLKGPNNTYWGNHARQGGGEGGRLKQFYYDLRMNHFPEFSQMWSEIDEKSKKVNSGNDKIDSEFPTTGKRKEITKMPLQIAISHLTEILINRLFWIYQLYSGETVISVNFDDYRRYFSKNFILYSSNENSIGQYGTLMGFSIHHGTNLSFGQLLEEEMLRVKTKKPLNFDLQNSFLLDHVFDILEKISRSPTIVFKNRYPAPHEFWDSKAKDKYSEVKKILEQLEKEKPTNELTNPWESRQHVAQCLTELLSTDEYSTYPAELKSQIQKAKATMTLGA